MHLPADDSTEDRDQFPPVLYSSYRPSFSQVIRRSSCSQPRDSGGAESGIRRLSAAPRSKSHGRDPRLADLARAYQTSYTDSSASIAPSPLYSGYSFGTGTLDTRSVHSLDTGSVHSFDTRSVNSIDTTGSVRSLDTRSVQSLENHLQNWSPLERDEGPAISGKRKFSTFDDAISDSDDDEVVAKRPRTPENYDGAEVSSDGSKIINILRRLVRGVFSLVLLLLVVVFLLGSYAAYKDYQCSYKQSQAIDINTIETELSSALFGQHLAQAEIVSSIHSFIESSTTSSPLLILFLCGWLGTGKTHTATILSSFIPSHTTFITSSLPSTVQGVGSKVGKECGLSTIVLDDLDSADNDALDIIEDLIVNIYNDSNSKSNGTIIIATTSSGGHSVNKVMLEMAKTSLASRDKVVYDDIMEALEDEKANIPLYTALTDHNISVKLIPFLPLTRDHLRMCVTKLAREQGISISDKKVDTILDQVQYFSKDLPIFAKTGCKQISAKLDLMMGTSLEL